MAFVRSLMRTGVAAGLAGAIPSAAAKGTADNGTKIPNRFDLPQRSHLIVPQKKHLGRWDYFRLRQYDPRDLR
ncbi:MAG: hypothetical protein HY017_26025 [Betaproteobacteria bacterium]|nr:hypothetical protein [Betaproteobacteria bacterium]